MFGGYSMMIRIYDYILIYIYENDVNLINLHEYAHDQLGYFNREAVPFDLAGAALAWQPQSPTSSLPTNAHLHQLPVHQPFPP